MAAAVPLATKVIPVIPEDWRARLGAKLVDLGEAVSHVKAGDRVGFSIAQATPFSLCTALAGRLAEIDNVTVSHGAALFDWDLPGLGESFRLESFYISPFDRPLNHRGSSEFVPINYYRQGALPYGLDNFNVYMVTVSPPNHDGMVSFGDCQIMSKLMARKASLVIGEIDESLIWTAGDNCIHVDEFDYFVERVIPMPALPLPPPPEEEVRTVSTICAMVAKELIPNRATIQVGVGSTSGMLMAHLSNHHELGMQTEIIPWGTTPLVRDGVITGQHKRVFPGLVVGAAFALLTPPEELAYANGDPRFHLYDFNLTDDIRLIAREDGLISVNNALSADLSGQVASESIGPHAYTGTGGQTAFAVGAAMAGGKVILVLPSTAMVKGTRVSRIVPTLAEGSVITVNRGFVHYVVTEYGIADLRGKSIRDRARAMVAIAHPDFRNELSAAARKIWS